MFPACPNGSVAENNMCYMDVKGTPPKRRLSRSQYEQKQVSHGRLGPPPKRRRKHALLAPKGSEAVTATFWVQLDQTHCLSQRAQRQWPCCPEGSYALLAQKGQRLLVQRAQRHCLSQRAQRQCLSQRAQRQCLSQKGSEALLVPKMKDTILSRRAQRVGLSLLVPKGSEAVTVNSLSLRAQRL